MDINIKNVLLVAAIALVSIAVVKAILRRFAPSVAEWL